MKRIKCVSTVNPLFLSVLALISVILIITPFTSVIDFLSLNEVALGLIISFYILFFWFAIQTFINHFRAATALANGERLLVKVDDISCYSKFGHSRPLLFLVGDIKNIENHVRYEISAKTNLDFENTISVVCNSCMSKNDPFVCPRCKKANKFLKYRSMFFYVYFHSSKNIAAVDWNNFEFHEESNDAFTSNYNFENSEFEI